MDELKKEKLNDKLLIIAFKEIILCLIFAGLTLAIAYQMVDTKAYAYQNNLKNLFNAGHKSTSFFHVYKKLNFIIYWLNVLYNLLKNLAFENWWNLWLDSEKL